MTSLIVKSGNFSCEIVSFQPVILVFEYDKSKASDLSEVSAEMRDFEQRYNVNMWSKNEAKIDFYTDLPDDELVSIEALISFAVSTLGLLVHNWSSFLRLSFFSKSRYFAIRFDECDFSYSDLDVRLDDLEFCYSDGRAISDSLSRELSKLRAHVKQVSQSENDKFLQSFVKEMIRVHSGVRIEKDLLLSKLDLVSIFGNYQGYGLSWNEPSHIYLPGVNEHKSVVILDSYVDSEGDRINFYAFSGLAENESKVQDVQDLPPRAILLVVDFENYVQRDLLAFDFYLEVIKERWNVRKDPYNIFDTGSGALFADTEADFGRNEKFDHLPSIELEILRHYTLKYDTFAVWNEINEAINSIDRKDFIKFFHLMVIEDNFVEYAQIAETISAKMYLDMLDFSEK